MTCVTGLGLLESVRWVGDAVWFSDWLDGTIHRFDTGTGEDVVVTHQNSFPLCFDVSGERLLVLNGAEQTLLVGDIDGTWVERVDLHALGLMAGNEVLAAPDGGCYLNFGNFDPRQGFPTEPVGAIVHVSPDRALRVVATDLAFPNGMALLDHDTVVVAESHAARLTAFDITSTGDLVNRRTWADTPGYAPDGITASARGTIWFADVPNHSVVEIECGGTVRAVLPQDRGCFSCALHPDGTRLAVAGAHWPGGARLHDPTHRWDGTLGIIPLP